MAQHMSPWRQSVMLWTGKRRCLQGLGDGVEALLGGIQGGHCPARQVEQPQEAEERPQPKLCIP